MDNKSSNRVTLFLLVLTALGVPVAALAVVKPLVSLPPWLTVIILVSYELTVLGISFIIKVWHQLELLWVQRIASSLDTRIQHAISRYMRRYQQHIVYEHRDFDVKGLSTQGTFTLNLEQVFVDLRVAPQPVQKITTDPLYGVPAALRKGQHALEDFLRSPTGQHLAVIGTPGSGKTTLLKHLALTLAHTRWYHLSMRRKRLPFRLPILLFLRDHVERILSDSTSGLAQCIEDHLSNMHSPVSLKWLEGQLARGGCLIMLDGLDEVADTTSRAKVATWIETQMQSYPRNRFVVTSRPFGYRSNPIAGVTVLEVRPFTVEQVERFVRNWYLANEIMSSQRLDPGVRMVANNGANQLLKRLRRTPALMSLTVNPLLLTMIATVHRYRSSLPGRRVELYAEICDVFLGKRQQARGLTTDLTPSQKQSVLQPLAYEMMRQRVREISIDQAASIITGPLARVTSKIDALAFLTTVENSSGLVIEREKGVYSFAHLTFQEYLSAIHIREMKLEAYLLDKVEDSWWHECIRLYCAQADASTLILECLTRGSVSIPALALAIECAEEALKVDPYIRAELEKVLEEGLRDPNPERRSLVVGALLALRVRSMMRSNEKTDFDTSLITCAEYQLFLDEQPGSIGRLEPPHWQGAGYPLGAERDPVLGIQPASAEAFCNWLSERGIGDWTYRLPRASEIPAEIRDANHLNPNQGYWVSSHDGSEVEGCEKPALMTLDNVAEQLAEDVVLGSRLVDEADKLQRILGLDCTPVFEAQARMSYTLLPTVRPILVALDRTLPKLTALDLDRAFTIERESAVSLLLSPSTIEISIDSSSTDFPFITREISFDTAVADVDRYRTAIERTLRFLREDIRSGSSQDHEVDFLPRDGNGNIVRLEMKTMAHSRVVQWLGRVGRRSKESEFMETLERMGASAPICVAGKAMAEGVTKMRTLNRTTAESIYDVALVRRIIRVSALIIANEFLPDLRRLPMARTSLVQWLTGRRDNARRKADVRSIIDLCLRVYLSYAWLEQRIGGHLIPFEGLLLARDSIGETTV